jgi:oligoribonuclease
MGIIMNKAQHLVWIDLEMTGLTPEKDLILEIAAIVTDGALNHVADGPSLIIHYDVLPPMNEWVQKQHTKSGLLQAVHDSTISLKAAELQVLDFLKVYCEKGVSPLCGNSVGQDRAFMRLYMPSITDFLHYRTIDVTSFKEVITRWYPNNPKTEFVKQDKHRALDDILESIEQLRYYRRHFFI